MDASATDGETTPRADWRARPPAEISVDVVLPAFNEAHVLARSVRTLHGFLAGAIPYDWRIVLAVNGATDDTERVARLLCAEFDRTTMIVLDRSGRGGALRAAWTASRADLVCYTDVDLSTSLEALSRCLDALRRGADLAVGSRLLPGSRTTRSRLRQVISVAYNRLLRLTLGVRFTDAQTGFKALTRQVVDEVLPLVESERWFLDTELLVLAEWLGFRVADLPIEWVEDPDSRVNLILAIAEDLRGIARLRRRRRRPDAPLAAALRAPRAPRR
jgi:glycosyltransferase involved in cell wall biosynthesis